MAGLNKNNSAVKRIMQEARELANDPSPEYSAAPLEDDIFEWHCTLRGPAGTEFEGALMMLTPSGRFETDTKICISFTSYHEELWQPAWGVRTAILGLQGFFPLKGKAAVGVGSIEHPTVERKRLATLSRSWVCPHCRQSNLQLLPEVESPGAAPAVAPLEASAPVLPPTPPPLATVVEATATAPVVRTREQRPPLLLDTAICIILVLVCSILLRRMLS
ncbi:ubiquitin-conjugating enzyme/RWD-like protein [Mycena amicta]|nr:ubiquitin-conjugating enzyme/RWD-like protein [Mycena amicta]